MRTCKLCKRPYYAKGYCEAHWRSEIWITPEYRAWQHMKTRCYNFNAKNYDNYGGRGIEVCERWVDNFKNFLEDMGTRPDGYSLDRIENDGDYEPGNCRWATRTQQNRNSRKVVCNYKMAQEIRERYKTGKYTCRSLGAEYGISYGIVGSIIGNESWIIP